MLVVLLVVRAIGGGSTQMENVMSVASAACVKFKNLGKILALNIGYCFKMRCLS